MDSLEFNVSTLLQQDVGATLTDDIAVQNPLELEGVTVNRVLGSARLTRTNFGILARAKLTAVVTVECDRCLSPYDAAIDVDFSEEFLPVVDVATGRPVQSERIDETFLISPNHVVDLTEAARQHILLALPMHSLCREDCQGLCPTCGINRNTDHCDCTEESEGPFSVLSALLKDSNPE
jgi:uncharacterized protein